MIELKDYQRKAINELKGKIIDMLNQEGDRQRLVFKAPTGSGKTVMASALIDELTHELPINGSCIYTRVAWVWIAPNKLHQQSYRSMRNYFSETRALHPVMFDECDHLSGLQPGDVLFLNWESVNKDNAVMIRDNEQNRTLYELLRATRIQQKMPIVVVIDEEHMFGGRNAVKSERLLQSINPKLELRISATPVTQTYKAVEIDRAAVVAEEMIKKGIQLNPGLRSSNEQSALTVNQRLLAKALAKRDELAQAYAAHGINPLLLIQLPNDTSDSLSAADRTIADEMKSYLADMCDITVDNGKLAVWLSKDKSPNLESITRRDDLCQVLLFKQAIALGWDCPRAAVLLIFRELKSMIFTTQTVGRILRMPDQQFYADERLNYGYVYTNLSEDIISIVGDDMNYISTIHADRRKDLANITLPSVYIDRHNGHRNRLGAEFREIFKKVMRQAWEQNPVSLFEESMFEDDEQTAPTTSDEQPDIAITTNRNNARRHGVRLDVARILIAIPKDTPLTGEDGLIQVTDKARLALNATELDELFTLFCRKNVGSFAKYDSTPVLKGAIESALEEYLQVFSTDVPRVVLYDKNRPRFEELIRTSLNQYAAHLQAQHPSVNEPSYKTSEWHVPEMRLYNSAHHNNRDGEVFNHALRPFFESISVSGPEYAFARWVDRQSELVDWWYKNGDEGKAHFAVPYTSTDGRRRCFYVDFIIRLKDGTICLLDTKSHGSDAEGDVKNNALYHYVVERRRQGMNIIGGVVIREQDNWYYPEGIVDNIENIENWKLLDFRNL